MVTSSRTRCDLFLALAFLLLGHVLTIIPLCTAKTKEYDKLTMRQPNLSGEGQKYYISSLMERYLLSNLVSPAAEDANQNQNQGIVSKKSQPLRDNRSLQSNLDLIALSHSQVPSQYEEQEGFDLLSLSPTISPTLSPNHNYKTSYKPSDFQTLSPSSSFRPSTLPSTYAPSISKGPSAMSSRDPTSFPTVSAEPSFNPSISIEPSISTSPSDFPSDIPSSFPTELRKPDRGEEASLSFMTKSPSFMPSTSSAPSRNPTEIPSLGPTTSTIPSIMPSDLPSDVPSTKPTISQEPSLSPTLSLIPSMSPSTLPSISPSMAPSGAPSSTPSGLPSASPSSAPTKMPSTAPSAAPSESPTLVCHDKLDYKSPINGFVCADHVGTSCLHWRFLGLSLDDVEKLINSCPVSCEIDCGTLTRFDITISYQISRVPGLMDAETVDNLDKISQAYLSDFVHKKEPSIEFFIDSTELLSQTVLSRKATNSSERDVYHNGSRRALAEQYVSLWVSVAFRGIAIKLSVEDMTTYLVSGIDSLGYSEAIQHGGNDFLQHAYAISPGEKTNETVPHLDNNKSNQKSTALVVVFVVFFCVAAFITSLCVYHKRSERGLPCRIFQARKTRVRDVHSPDSVNMASHIGSMFSFDDTATVGTNGLMRFIGSFNSNRSDDSTSPGSTVQKSSSNDGGENMSLDEETGVRTSRPAPTPISYIDEEFDDHNEDGNDDADDEDDEPHPLTGLIPPMIVYDHIDNEVEDKTEHDQQYSGILEAPKPKKRKWGPVVVPARRVEASQRFIAALSVRQRPSALNQFSEYLSDINDFDIDPATIRWKRRLESRRPSPIGIVMDSSDDISVVSTPVRLQESDLERHTLRRTRSLEDCSVLDSLSDIIVSEQDFGASISPMEHPNGGRDSWSPSRGPMTSLPLPLVPTGSPKTREDSPIVNHEDPQSFTWVRGNKTSPDTPSRLIRSFSQSQIGKPKQPGVTLEAAATAMKHSFWNRSPIAKGVKDAIWSTKRSITPDASQMKKNTFAMTPRSASHTRGASSEAPGTSTQSEFHVRQSSNGAPSTVSERPDIPTRRSCTPTRMEMMGRKIPTPTRETLMLPRRSQSPVTRGSLFSNRSSPRSDKNSDIDSQGDVRYNLNARSASFSTELASNEEEVVFEFRAPRIGKLGLLINSTPHTGPMVEQVKDYSTLFGRIRAGDKIVEVDGMETSRMTIKEVTKRLNGKYGIRTHTGEVRIKVARICEREWSEEESKGSGSIGSFSSFHRRNHSDPEPLLDRLSLNSMSEHRLSSYSYSNHSKECEEI